MGGGGAGGGGACIGWVKRGDTIATESSIRDPDLSTRIGDTVAAEFLGLTWAEFRPPLAEAGDGPLAVLSGVLPVDEAEA